MSLKKYLALNFSIIFITSVIATDLRRILPLRLQIREGEDLQLRLTKILSDNISCYVKTPLLTSYNLQSEESDSDERISYWTENGECGVRAKNVTKVDTGRWRLTAKNADQTLVDTTFVEILDKEVALETSVSIESGLGYTLTLKENSKYCSIQPPYSDQTILISGACKVDLHQPTAAEQGNWLAITGVVGQLQEIHTKVELNVYRDKLATGFIQHRNTDTINAYCNLKDSDKKLEFCRFARPDSAQTGFQLSEGLHSGRYGYFGAGLQEGACGISIEAPTEEDYGQWLCSVGVTGEEPFGSFVLISRSVARSTAITAQALPTNATTTSLSQKLQLQCEANIPISYCRFVAPDGSIFKPMPWTELTDGSYKYVGNGFGKGQCGIEIASAQSKHDGQWKCYMGPEAIGFELTSTISVRIAETNLAATDIQVTGIPGEILSIECRTVPERVAIHYCRFLMPDGTGIHINDEVTDNNPLTLGEMNYWFSGGSMRLGNCGLKVNKFDIKHAGQWTCAALLEPIETNTEAFDTIVVNIGESSGSALPDIADNESHTGTATTGIITGVLVGVAIIAAGSFFAVKKIRARLQQNEDLRMEEISEIASTTSSMSSTSTNSGIMLQVLSSNDR